MAQATLVTNGSAAKQLKLAKGDGSLFSMKDGLHPGEKLLSIAKQLGCSVEDVEFALYMDQNDPLRRLRDEFFYPKMKDLESSEIVFCASCAQPSCCACPSCIIYSYTKEEIKKRRDLFFMSLKMNTSSTK